MAGALFLLSTGGAFGRAEVGTFYDQQFFSDTTTDFPCALGVPVRITGTVTDEGRFTNVEGNHHSGVGTETIEYRIDLPDGRYALGSVVGHFSLSINFHHSTWVNTSEQDEQATLYGSDGTPIGQMIVKGTTHITYFDANGNGEPDPDEVRSELENFRVEGCS